MWLTLYLILLVFLAYQSFFWSPFHLYVVGCVLYILVYLLHPEKREWHWFRSWSFWDHVRKWYFPHHIHSVHWADLSVEGKVYVFMVVNPVSLVDTVLAFGLHGKKNPVLNRLSPLIMAPAYLFYVPYVTDAVQWAGLVPERTRSKSYTEITNDILSGEDFSGLEFGGDGLKKSLVAPHYTRSALGDENSLQMLRWAAERASHGLTNLCIVPVMHRGSSLLYRKCQSSPFPEPLHWRPPWPFFGFGFMFSCLPRRTELNTFVGRPIPVIDNVQVLAEAFSREMACLRKAADANTLPDDDWDIEKGDT